IEVMRMWEERSRVPEQMYPKMHASIDAQVVQKNFRVKITRTYYRLAKRPQIALVKRSPNTQDMPARDLRLTLPTARLTAIRFLPAFLAWFGLLVCPRLSTAQYSVSVDGTCDPVFYDPTYLSLDPNTTSGALEI